MLLIRRFEEKVEERFRAGELPGFLHVAIGQEAVAVGVCRALEDGDVIASTHRAHGHTLAQRDAPERAHGRAVREARGLLARLRRLDAPLRRRAREPRRERRRRRRAAAITGAALAFKLRGEPRVAVAFFGDGATNIGTFHESLNLAQLWKVPARLRAARTTTGPSRRRARQHSPIRGPVEARRSPSACTRSRSTARTSRRSTTRRRGALEHARSGKGPVFLACRDLPPVGHYVGDPQVYRSKEEQRERPRDAGPDRRSCARSSSSPTRSSSELDAEVQEIVDASVEFAKAGTDPKPEDALKNVYA